MDWLFKYLANWKNPILQAFLLSIIIVFLIHKFLLIDQSSLLFRIAISSLIFIICMFFIYHKLYKFPKNPIGKIGVIFCITSQYDVTKQSRRDELIDDVKNMIIDKSLHNLINIVSLDENRSIRASKILDNYKYIRSLNIEVNNPWWTKFQKKLNGHYYIWGCIRKNPDNSEYFLYVDQLILHSKIESATSTRLSKEMRDILPKRFEVIFDSETLSFNVPAQMIAIATKYIIGIAALISGDSDTAFILHSDLSIEISNNEKLLVPEDFNDRLQLLMSEELYWIAMKFYYTKKDYPTCLEYVNKAIEKNPDYESAIILSQATRFLLNESPEQILHEIKSMQKKSKNIILWYNEAFILMYIGKFKESYEVYLSIAEIEFETVDIVALDCIKYIENIYNKDDTKKQLIFTIGFLYNNMIRNFPKALDFYTKFLDESKSKKKNRYNHLRRYARKGIREIEQTMKLK